MSKAFGPHVVLVMGVVLAAVPFGRDSLLAQSRRFTSGVELVPLTVTVTDRAGRYVPDLTAADFAIFEEGRRQAISHFASVMRRSTWDSSSIPAAACGTTSVWRRKRHADCGSGSGTAIVRPSLASGHPFRVTSR